MIIAQTFELFSTQHVRQESENLHVCEFNVILTFLQMRVIEGQDTISDSNITRLFRLVLEFDHADGDLTIDVHVLPLVDIEQFPTVTVGHLVILFLLR